MVTLKTRRKQKTTAQVRYRETAKGKATERRYRRTDSAKAIGKRWREKSKVLTAVHRIVRDAKKAGELSEQPCEVCGTTVNIHAHHDDYSKPLDIRWFCILHHARHHRK